MISSPAFWWREPGAWARLLQPLGLLYGAVAAWRMGFRGERSRLPVLCVGNFVTGGAGKTPFAIELVRRLSAMGERPVFLTRGYGGALAGPILVAAGHRASEVGDEALLLARHAPTIVARARVAGARLAEATGATVIVMDDGFQNPSLAKDLSFIVVDATAGIGNGLCVPAGPLRAPLRAQWKLAQALVIIRAVEPSRHLTHPVLTDADQFLPGQKEEADPSGTSEAAASPPSADNLEMAESAWAVMAEANRRHLPLISAALRPEPLDAEALRGRKVVGFAGIGRPSKFFATLRSIGADLVAERGFPDHHNFSANDLSCLAEGARRADAVLVTTEKDMARIGDLAQKGLGGTAKLAEIPLYALRVELDVSDSEGLDSLLRGVMRARRPASHRA